MFVIENVWNISQQNNSEAATNDHGKQILKERYNIHPEERQEIIDSLILIW